MSDHILIDVEDNPADTELLRAAAEEIGWDVRIIRAADGGQAMRMLTDCARRQDCPPAILIDLNMPRVDGWQLLEWMAGRDGVCAIRLVYSSSSLDQDRERAYGLGAAEYLVKPQTWDGVITTMRYVRELVTTYGALLPG